METILLQHKKKTPWSESASELYRQSDRRLSTYPLQLFIYLVYVSYYLFIYLQSYNGNIFN
jgi:hypothetical protein